MRAADSLLSITDRKLIAIDVVESAVALAATQVGDSPSDRVGLVAALRPVYHLANAGALAVELVVGALLLRLVEQHETLGDLRAAYGCACFTLEGLPTSTSPAFMALSTKLRASRNQLLRQLPPEATTHENEYVARSEVKDPALGLEARIWAAISLLDRAHTRAEGVEAAEELTNELNSYADELGSSGIQWRILLAFQVGHAGQLTISERLLRPLITDPGGIDDHTRDLAARVLAAVSGAQSDLHLGRSLFQVEYDNLTGSADP